MSHSLTIILVHLVWKVNNHFYVCVVVYECFQFVSRNREIWFVSREKKKQNGTHEEKRCYVSVNARDTYPKLTEIMLARDSQDHEHKFSGFFLRLYFSVMLQFGYSFHCLVVIVLNQFSAFLFSKEFREFSSSKNALQFLAGTSFLFDRMCWRFGYLLWLCQMCTNQNESQSWKCHQSFKSKLMYLQNDLHNMHYKSNVCNTYVFKLWFSFAIKIFW